MWNWIKQGRMQPSCPTFSLVWEKITLLFMRVPRTMCGRLLCFIIVASLFVLFGWSIGSVYPQSPKSPDALLFRWILLVAPGISCGIAALVAIDYLAVKAEDSFLDSTAKNKSNYLQAILLAGSFTPGQFMSLFHIWWAHLLILFVLYMLFCIWDSAMLRLLKINNGTGMPNGARTEIRSTSIGINRPTVVAIICCAVVAFHINDDSLRDAFVTGLVAFHLVVAAFGYFLASLSPGLEGNGVGLG